MTAGTRHVTTVLSLVVMSACGSDQQSIPVGSYESVISGTRSELDGAWTLSIEPEGRFRIALDGQPAVTGSYAYDDGGVTFSDESGPMMCAAGATRGSYLWKFEKDRLELLVVADECPGRRGILTRQPHRRKSGG